MRLGANIRISDKSLEIAVTIAISEGKKVEDE